MKPSAYIFSLLILCMMAQPLLMECQAKKIEEKEKMEIAAGICSKPSAAAKAEKKTCDPGKNKECEKTNTGNSPSCYSQCQYIDASKFTYQFNIDASKQNLFPSPSDNLASGFNANCWQPPEFVLV